jgi:hypothetical protein
MATLSFPGENSGDSRFRMYRPTFQSGFDSLRAAFVPRLAADWEVNVIFRSPVHNLRHVNPASRPSANSWHMYGCAADLQTFPRGASGSATTSETYKKALA